MAFKRKVLAGITAVSLAVLLATGTFAWTSLNSQKLNEWHGTGDPGTGPGGTLHDDHRENEENKAVYVENWGNEDLFVRVRLSEYMELGTGAGLKSVYTDPSTGEIVHNPQNLSKPLFSGPLNSDANIDSLDTWRINNPYEAFPDINFETSPDVYNGPTFRTYWMWEMGGQKYYYPAPAANREDKGYIDQNSPVDLTADSVNDDGVQAKQTHDAELMSMRGWIEEGLPIGAYWVFDSDGWAYWAAPLKPGEATGLLLNKVKSNNKPEKDYYYGINVIAQMATRDGDDLDNYKSFGLDINSGWTQDGERLMKYITEGVDFGDNDDFNIVDVEPVDYLEDGITRIQYSPAILNEVIYVKQGQTLTATGVGVGPNDMMAFNPYLKTSENYSAGHTYNSAFFNIEPTAQIGYRDYISGKMHLNVSGSTGTQTIGPEITVPFVVIPAECQGVVFGKSGKVYINYGNTYQELRDDGTLGGMISKSEIV